MNKTRGALAALIATLIAAFFYFHLGHYLSLGYLKSEQARLQHLFHARPLATAGVFFLCYVLITGLSLPGATLMTLAAGAIFGLLWGTVIVSFASSLGATLAFLAARFVLRDLVQRKYGHRLTAINRGIERDGGFYLFALRLVPAFPFFVINLVMGLTPIRALTFYGISQAGMLAGTVVFINAGTQLGEIHSLSGILSPGLIGSFVLLGIFPLIAKRVLAFLQSHKRYRGLRKPRHFDRNLIVIGAGSAGLVSAYIAATVKARVTLIEKDKMGGDCLNYGCVPSKALIRSARLLSLRRRAGEFGFKHIDVAFDFADVMERVQRVVETVAPHDSVERYERLGVECLQGEARILSPWEVEVGGRRLTTRAIVVATGARPRMPAIEGLAEADCLTSETLWSLRTLPRRLIVLGGGPIGCEMAQAFARLGSRVTQVEMQPQLMTREDPDVADAVLQRFREEGIEVLLSHTARAVRVDDSGEKTLICEHEGQEKAVPFDAVLIALGRQANAQGYGLEALGIGTGPGGTIETDEYLRTRVPNIYACGDAAGPYQFTHTAAHQAWYATVNALFGSFRKFKVDYSVIPWCTFTDPEVAHVGLNETRARETGVAYETTVYDMSELDRAITEREARGFIKVLTPPGKDKVLGATIVGENAGELITEYVTAMKQGLGLNRLLGTIHVYPTLAEANKYAAGEWKKAHAPQGVLKWLQRWHAFQRR